MQVKDHVCAACRYVPGFFSVPMKGTCMSLTDVHWVYIPAWEHHCLLPKVSILHRDSNRCYIDCCPISQTVWRQPFSTRVSFYACPNRSVTTNYTINISKYYTGNFFYILCTIFTIGYLFSNHWYFTSTIKIFYQR